MSNLEPALTINGRTSVPAILETDFGYLRGLQRMNGKDLFAECLWHFPAGSDPEKITPASDNYLQTAGTSERLTLELRVTGDDGRATHYVLGRGPITGEATEQIEWDGASTSVHSEEVWTAEQAAPVFEEYAVSGRVPEGVHKRAVDI